MKHLIYQMCVGITYLFLSYWWQSNTQIWRWVRGSSSCFETCWPVERCSYWCTNDYSATKEEKPNNFLTKLVRGAIYIVQCPLFFEYTFLCLVLCIEVEKTVGHSCQLKCDPKYIIKTIHLKYNWFFEGKLYCSNGISIVVITLFYTN